MEARDKPSAISEATLSSSGHSLRQSGMIKTACIFAYVYPNPRVTTLFSMHTNIASQMSLLGRILPLLVGRMVELDDSKWENFILLMEIVDILFCPMYSREHVASLEKLIERHHHEFVKLYPSCNFIPKMHFLVHMPRLKVTCLLYGFFNNLCHPYVYFNLIMMYIEMGW